MALKDPYCSNAEADVILADNADWLALTEAEKTEALTVARYYIDDRYNCTSVDEDDVPSELKQVNAWLGADQIDTGLFDTSTAPERIKSKSVKAGAVSTSKSYFSATQFRPATKAKCDAYLNGICVRNGIVIPLQRV